MTVLMEDLLMIEWKNLYRGIVMGISDLVPGVSGGTIAVLLGIYDRFIGGINGIFSREWKRHVAFLLPLAIGMGFALFSFSRLMDWLLATYHRPTFYFFIGLIIGVLPFLLHTSRARTSFRWQHFGLLIVAAVAINLIPITVSNSTLIVERSLFIYMLFFFSGMLASAAMVLPGISGSFVLLVIGMYHTIIRALSNLEIFVIITVGIGIASGMLLMSKLIHYFLQHYRTSTFAVIIGLVCGSVFIIFRQAGWVQSVNELFICIVTFLAGICIAYLLGKVEYA